MQLTTNFSLAELTRTSQKGTNVPNADELNALKALASNILQPLRDALGKPIQITSGFRSAAVNRAVGGASTSQHRFGQAADIKVAGMTPFELATKIVELGLPYDQVIQEPTWVHVSFGPRHRREQLTAEMKKGRMVYRAGLNR